MILLYTGITIVLRYHYALSRVTNSYMTDRNRPDATTSWAHPIKAVAFDMDGLLVNTEELYSEVGAALLSRRGKQFTRELKDAMTGLPGPAAFAVMIQTHGLSESAEQLAMESAELFSEILPTKLRTLPGVVELLDFLDARELRRCVATSSSPAFASRVLEITELTSRFEFVVTAQDVEHGKPSPDIYFAAALRMEADATSMMVLEDSHHGPRAGVASGACTVAVPGPHSAHHDFTGVHYRADTLNDACIREILASD